ncbi:Ig-like domain-containing protein [Acinetobacter gerneri]|uniref:Ig-like domain-containing protein n=1 Tax=Acinetobacter gerneri TaxID=202952 RepID=UPI003212C85D
MLNGLNYIQVYASNAEGQKDIGYNFFEVLAGNYFKNIDVVNDANKNNVIDNSELGASNQVEVRIGLGNDVRVGDKVTLNGLEHTVDANDISNGYVVFDVPVVPGQQTTLQAQITTDAGKVLADISQNISVDGAARNIVESLKFLNDLNSDGALNKAELNGQITTSVEITLGSGARAGDVVFVNGLSYVLNASEIQNGKLTISIPIRDGLNQVDVTAKDEWGYVDHVTGSIVANVSGNTPILTLIAPALTNDATPKIEGIADAGNTVHVVVVDSAGNSQVADIVVNSSGKWVYEPAQDLADGAYTVTAIAKDAIGNQSASVKATGEITATATDPAGNISGPGSTIVDTIPPTGLIVSFEEDTGLAGDGITSNGTINVTGVEDDANWSYSTDGGLSWTPGTGGSFELEEGTYQDVQVKQQDAAGNEEIVDFGKVVIDKTAPTGLSAQLADDTGFSNSDGITQNGLVNVTGIEEGATWSYSLNGGQSWIKGEGTSFTVPVGD